MPEETQEFKFLYFPNRKMLIKFVYTFDFGADDVDVFIVGGGRSEESHPVAVAHSVSVDLCDLVVAAESVSYLQQRSTTNISDDVYKYTQTSDDRNSNAKTHLKQIH